MQKKEDCIMKKIAMGIVVGLLFMVIVSTASASLAEFAGYWVNTNSNTRGITKVVITISGTNVMVHAWSQCDPTACDWGKVQGFAYGPNVSSNLQSTAQSISVIYKDNVRETLMIMRYVRYPLGLNLWWNRLRVETYTRFTDASGRTNYEEVETFNKKPGNF
jgi:hypothetical protein